MTDATGGCDRDHRKVLLRPPVLDFSDGGYVRPSDISKVFECSRILCPLKGARIGAAKLAHAALHLVDGFCTGPEGYLCHIEAAKKAVQIPIVASLNGSTLGGWTKYARAMEDAGADAIECNIYFIPSDMNVSGTEVEHLDGIRRLEDAGASAVVLYSLFEEQLRRDELELDYHQVLRPAPFAD